MSFKVTVRPSGQTFEVGPDESILEAALRSGEVIPYSCRNGSCTSCAGQIVEGRVAYPRGVLPPGLSAREAETGRALLCQARACSDLVLDVSSERAPGEPVVKTLPARVVALHRLAPDVMRLYLKLPATEEFVWRAGQYIDILLRDGRRRAFSIANRPGADEFLELHVRLVPGGEFTTHVFEQMRERAILRLQGPFGRFFLREASPRPWLLMAGGTGFAPLKAMLEQALQGGLNRAVHLYWGARDRAGLYLHELVEGWADTVPGLRYTPVLSEADAGWRGRTGWVHAALLADYPPLAGYDVYMSGPPPMIDAARAGFAAHGLPAEQLFFDSFDFASDVRAAP